MIWTKGLMQGLGENVIFITLLIFSIMLILWVTTLLDRKISVVLDEISKLKTDISIINNEIEVLTSHLRRKSDGGSNVSSEQKVQA